MESPPLTTLIVDDERIARQVLREELELFSGIKVVGEAEDGMQALRQIADLHPDLVLLDVQMPVLGGFDVVRNLAGKELPAVVMVTAYDQYAIQAFEAGAIDYLLKPVSLHRLKQAIERVQRFAGQSREVALDLARIAAARDCPASHVAHKIVGLAGKEYVLLDSSEVLAFQAERELVWIVTAERRLLSTQTLRSLEAKLPPAGFLRVHRNSIVNVNHIHKVSSLSSNRWLLTLGSGMEFVVSKRLAHTVRQILNW